MHNLSTGRGRRRGGRSHSDWRVLDYLARLAINKTVDPSTLFSSLVEAWKQGESTCEKIVILRRKKTRDSAMFLFTLKQKVLAQFMVPEYILNENDPIKRYIDTKPSTAFSVKKPPVKKPKIVDLEQRMRHINIKARVVETPKPQLVWTRFGTTAYVSNVLIADETGTIRLSLWNQQIDKVSVDDVIKIENAKVTRYRGKRQLRIERNGKLSVIDEAGFPLNLT